MGLRLVDDGSSPGDDRAALADARRSALDARLRLQALADQLADLRRRLAGDGQGGDTPPDGQTTDSRSPTSGD